MFQEEYQERLSKIIKIRCLKSTKIGMLTSLLEELKNKIPLGQVQPETKSKTITTEDTFFSDAQIDLPQEISDLEKKIILRRDVKIQLNQEIEDAEEELQSIDKTVLLKRQLDDELKRKIEIKMFEIQVNGYREKKKEVTKPTKANKTFSLFSRRVLDFFN